MKLGLLLLTAVFIFALGYRFFAKLLLIGLYTPDSDHISQYSPANSENGPSHSISFAHFVITLMGAGVIPGAGLAIIWGWVPAYLWIVSGTATIGGIYLMGSLWLSQQQGLPGLLDNSRQLLNPAASQILRILRALVLLGLAAVLLWICAWLLGHYPTISWAVIGQLLIALWLQSYWRKKGEQRPWLTSGLALIGLLALLAVGHGAPLTLSGNLGISIGDKPLMDLTAMTSWGIVILISSLALSQSAYNGAIRTRGWLSAMLTSVFLVILIAGLIISPPAINAPEFHTGETLPSRLPWLFVVLSSGAFAGIFALFAQPLAAAQLTRFDDLRRWGFGAAIAVASLALVTWVIFITNQPDTETWKAWVNQGQPWLPLNRILGQFIHHGATLIAATGLSEAGSRSLIALVLTGLSLATLDTVILMISRETRALASASLARWFSVNTWKLWLITTLPIMLALITFIAGPLSLNWLLFGPASYYLAACVFSLICLQIGQRMRIWPAMAAISLICWILATWTLVLQTPVWWTFSPWMLVPAALLFLFSSLFILIAAGRIVDHLKSNKA
jgi:carbon starvation protein